MVEELEQPCVPLRLDVVDPGGGAGGDGKRATVLFKRLKVVCCCLTRTNC